MPFRLGPWELGLILVIVLIVFGAGRLPQVGSVLGKAIRSFRKGQSGEDEEEPKSEKKALKKAEGSETKGGSAT